LLDLHGTALAKMLEFVSQTGEPGRLLLERFGADGLTGSLLLLHELHPIPLDARVLTALDRVRPHLRTQGGHVELLDVVGGVVRVRLLGRVTDGHVLRAEVEDVLVASAPDATAVEIVEAWETPVSLRMSLPLLHGS
jgi:Fe-S cluster biogenesis protein NfuA